MTKIQESGEKVLANVERVIVGKHHEVRLALVALLCKGHLLIEDVPGTGKTVLAKAIARLPWQSATRSVRFQKGSASEPRLAQNLPRVTNYARPLVDSPAFVSRGVRRRQRTQHGAIAYDSGLRVRVRQTANDCAG